MTASPTPPSTDASPAGVSIVLLMKNHRPYMARGFDIIAHQDFDAPVEFIYIDSGSTDGTIEFMRQRGIEPHIIPPQDFHHARTRNLAASMAHHDILVMLSADATPTGTRWLHNLTRHFADPTVAAVYGKQIPPEGTGRLRQRTMACLYPDERDVRRIRADGVIPMRYVRFSDANSAVRKSLWQRFPYYDRALVAEDHGMCYHALKEGFSVVYEPEAAVIHGHERSLWGDFQFAVDNAISLKRMGILDDPAVGSALAYGLAQVSSDLAYFLKRGRPDAAFGSLCIAFAKLAGVQVGKRETRFPRWFMRFASMNMKRLDG